MMTDFIGRGWSFPLDITPNGAVAVVGGARKLEQAMRLVLSTTPGERPYRPEFGCRLRDYVFDGNSVDVLARIAEDVRSALLRWEPRVHVNDVQVRPDPYDNGLIYIDISYTPKGENDPRNLVYPFYSIPDNEGD
jgi:phage baseplate assembly protein W